MKKHKIISKILALFLVFQIVFNPLIISVVNAQEVTGTPVPTETIITETPTPSNSTDTPAPQQENINITNIPNNPNNPNPTESLVPTEISQSTTITGDALSETTGDVTANQNQNNVNGTLTTGVNDCPSIDGQINCPSDVEIANENDALVSQDSTSSATTGSNETNDTNGDVLINTGDATASGNINNDINSNTVELSISPTPSVIVNISNPSDSPDSSVSSVSSQESSLPSKNPSEEKKLEVSNNNEADVENAIKVNSGTGENLASENLGNVEINTGDALAWLNLVNFINTNVIGSGFEFLYLDINDLNASEVDLNQVWRLLNDKTMDYVNLAGNLESGNLKLVVQNINNANLTNTADVCAVTGENQANSNNSASVNTGDATSLLNATNIVNTNIIGAKFFFGLINILGEYKGNLILPRMDQFLNSDTSQNSSSALFSNDNYVEIINKLNSGAFTGENSTVNSGGDQTVNTGNADSSANSFNLLNTNISYSNWFYFMLNVLGKMEGQTYSWLSPESVEENNQNNLLFQNELPNTGNSSAGNTNARISNENTANITNDLSAYSQTGANSAEQNSNGAKINTGNAKSYINLMNLANLNILGGNWFMGMFNVMGDWKGNVIFAYPDLYVGLKSDNSEVARGETFNYIVDYKNLGYDLAKNVSLKVEFPKGITYLSDNSGFSAECANQICVWKLGEFKRDRSGSFSVKVKIEENFFQLQNISLLRRIIPIVLAAEDSPSFTSQAVIYTSDPESNTKNNSSSATTGIRIPAVGGANIENNNSSSNEQDNRHPILEITAKNNVNGFIYKGDTVTFEIKVKNTGEVTARNAVLKQELYDGVPYSIGDANIPIGDIEPGKSGTLTFGIVMDGMEFPDEQFHTLTRITAQAPNGDGISSNEARTDFIITQPEKFAIIKEVIAVEENNAGEVLGQTCEDCNKKEKIFPYVLLFILSSAWMVERTKKLSQLLDVIKEKNA